MRTTGSTMSRFDKQGAVKSSGMPHSRRDNAVRGNPAAHQNTNRPDGRFVLGQKSFIFLCVFGTIMGESSGDTGSELLHARQIRCNMASRRESDVLSVKCVVIYH